MFVKKKVYFFSLFVSIIQSEGQSEVFHKDDILALSSEDVGTVRICDTCHSAVWVMGGEGFTTLSQPLGCPFVVSAIGLIGDLGKALNPSSIFQIDGRSIGGIIHIIHSCIGNGLIEVMSHRASVEVEVSVWHVETPCFSVMYIMYHVLRICQVKR